MSAPSAATLLRASAGTGKTYALVEEYVRLVQEEGLSPANIVAITYTRKAAGELTRRIDTRMRQAGCAEPLLAELARAPIGNFHALTQHWLDLDGWLGTEEPLGDILGEHEDESLFRLCVDKAWFGPHSSVRNDVEHVAEGCRLDDKLVTELWNALKAAREEARSIDATLMGEPYQSLAFGQRAQQTMHELFSRIVREQDNAQILTTPKARDLAARLASLPAPSAYEATDTWRKQWLAIWSRVHLGTNLKHLIAVQERDHAKSLPGLCEAEERCEGLQPRWGRLLHSAWQEYTREKRARRLHDFGDCLALAVSRMQTMPELHEKMRQHVAAVLVDEAQDVSAINRTLLHLLVGREGPATSSRPPARLFVVGDWKQCIYGFRGADAQMFSRITDDVLACGGAQRTLGINYRSSEAILRGVNAIGAHLFAQNYDSIEAPAAGSSSARHDDAPAITWWTVEDEAETDKHTSALAEARGCARMVRDGIEKGTSPGHVAILCQNLSKYASTLTRALSEQGVPSLVVSKGSLFEHLDVRQWLAMGAYLAAPGPAMDLPLAIALRSPWCDVSDDALFALLGAQGRESGAPQQFAQGLATAWIAALPEALRASEADSLTHLADSWHQASCMLSRLPVTEALEWLDQHLQLSLRMWRQPRAAQLLANWQRLLAMAERDEARGDTHARAFFLRHYQRMRLGEFEAEGRLPGRAHNAVTISTVHSAKGLEWDRVVLPFLSRQTRPDTDTVQFDREAGFVFAVRSIRGPLKSERLARAKLARKEANDEEVKRLLYVATTRARNRLDFVAAARPPRVSKNFAQHLQPLANAAPQWLHVATALPEAKSEPLPLSALPGTTTRLAHPRVPERTVLRASVSAWLQRVLPGDSRQADPDASRGEDEANLTPQAALRAKGEQELRAQRGILVHAVLAEWLGGHWATPTSLTGWQHHVTRIGRQQGLFLEREAVSTVASCLQALSTDSFVSTLCQLPEGEVMTEWPFRLRESCQAGAVDLEGTADVVARVGETLWLIDWKWRERAVKGPRHRLQLGAYALAAKRSLQWQGPLRCAAVYALAAEGSRVVEWAFDAAAERECTKALERALRVKLQS